MLYLFTTNQVPLTLCCLTFYESVTLWFLSTCNYSHSCSFFCQLLVYPCGFFASPVFDRSRCNQLHIFCDFQLFRQSVLILRSWYFTPHYSHEVYFIKLVPCRTFSCIGAKQVLFWEYRARLRQGGLVNFTTADLQRRNADRRDSVATL